MTNMYESHWLSLGWNLMVGNITIPLSVKMDNEYFGLPCLLVSPSLVLVQVLAVVQVLALVLVLVNNNPYWTSIDSLFRRRMIDSRIQ